MFSELIFLIRRMGNSGWVCKRVGFSAGKLLFYSVFYRLVGRGLGEKNFWRRIRISAGERLNLSGFRKNRIRFERRKQP